MAAPQVSLSPRERAGVRGIFSRQPRANVPQSELPPDPSNRNGPALAAGTSASYIPSARPLPETSREAPT